MGMEDLRRNAYSHLVIEKHDYNRIDKVVEGIYTGKVTKENFYADIKKLCRNVKSDHSISRWKCIADWFAKTNW